MIRRVGFWTPALSLRHVRSLNEISHHLQKCVCMCVCDPIPRRGNLSPRHAFISCACVLFATCSQLASPCSHVPALLHGGYLPVGWSGLWSVVISSRKFLRAFMGNYQLFCEGKWRKCTCDAWLFPLAGYCKFIMWCRWGAEFHPVCQRDHVQLLYCMFLTYQCSSSSSSSCSKDHDHDEVAAFDRCASGRLPISTR